MRRTLPLVVVLLLALVPGRAVAATVVNGDFESGTLSGWHVHQATEAGNWFAYQGTEAPIGRKLSGAPVQAPPQGTYAAIADEADPDTLVLSQELSLPAGSSDQLSLLAYYNSHDPIAVPTPDTLSVAEEELGGQRNQQFRIDVMKAGAPLESLDPADVLVNVFRTAPGAPQVMKPTKLTADLTPFAGQTVLLRIAVAAHQETLNAGVDEVRITGTGSGGPSGSGGRSGSSGSAGSRGGGGAAGRITLEKTKVDPRNGTVALPVRVPSAGVLRARGAELPVEGRHGTPAIRATGAPAARAGTVILHLAPTGAAWAILQQRRLLRTNVTVSFAPQAGGERSTQSKKVVLRLSPHGHGK
ncbi:MAG TPA: hypothetical protein VHS74_06290 [Solirubrobacterales bacterium]|jgi:hypothetical protein|nr:hypothetical protein [Solirubrobacterales bacterium]